MSIDPNLSIRPQPEQPRMASSAALPAEYAKIGLPCSEKAPSLGEASNSVAAKTSAAAHGLLFLGPKGDTESKVITNLFISQIARQL